jgi:hypothetical protein
MGASVSRCVSSRKSDTLVGIMELTPARALLLSRACRQHPAAFPFEASTGVMVLDTPEARIAHPGSGGHVAVHPSSLVVAGSAVVMAIATVANVMRHWHDGR